MGQLSFPTTYPDEWEVVFAYGGGVNSVAALLRHHKLGLRVPRAIIMANPGSEKRGTHKYRVEVMDPWLLAHGYPTVTVVTRAEEAQYRPRAKNAHQTTLREECMRLHALPSIAYGYKKCSMKWKAEPSNWWVARQPWARAAWALGQKVVRIVGYDAGEARRMKGVESMPPLERRRFAVSYPLIEAGIDRDGCEDIILSACTFCPSNTLEEWAELRDHDPERYAEAVAMSANAVLTDGDVVGLMRCLPHGKRQLHLHVWNDGPTPAVTEPDMPCECAL